MAAQAERFWDNVFQESDPRYISEEVHRAVAAALVFFGDVRGRRVLDLGCGNGGTALFLAAAGAEVTAVDLSAVAIERLSAYAAEHGVGNLTTVVGDASDIDRLGPFDYVFGSFILHHIEPFHAFADTLRATIRPGGKAYFFENNAASNLLIWFRTHVVGRMGVPRYGDDEEFPLTPAEVDMLRVHFDVRVDIPEMLFFQLVSVYLMRKRFRPAMKRLDDLVYRIKAIRPYSYRQSILLTA